MILFFKIGVKGDNMHSNESISMLYKILFTSLLFQMNIWYFNSHWGGGTGIYILHLLPISLGNSSNFVLVNSQNHRT